MGQCLVLRSFQSFSPLSPCKIRRKRTPASTVHQGSPLSAVLNPGWAVPGSCQASAPMILPRSIQRKKPSALSSHLVPFYRTGPVAFLCHCFNPGRRMCPHGPINRSQRLGLGGECPCALGQKVLGLSSSHHPVGVITAAGSKIDVFGRGPVRVPNWDFTHRAGIRMQ